MTVSNATGAASTSGTVTVTEAAPTGLTLSSMSGTGWTCTTLPVCTRADALAGGASYPAITVTVNVLANATSPQINSVSVSGGGSATASTTNSTTILAPALSDHEDSHGKLLVGSAERGVYGDGIKRSERGNNKRNRDRDRHSSNWRDLGFDGGNGMDLHDTANLYSR